MIAKTSAVKKDAGLCSSMEMTVSDRMTLAEAPEFPSHDPCVYIEM